MNMQSKNNRILYVDMLVIVLISIWSLYDPKVVCGIPIIGVMTSFYLYRSAEMQTGSMNKSRKVDVYRSMVILSAFVLALIFLSLLFSTIDQNYQKVLEDIRYALLIFFVMMFGNNAPRIPFNQTLGLRVSWTCRDEKTWRYAHRIVGYCSIPCAIVMIVAGLSDQKLAGYVVLIITMVLIPAFLSYLYDDRNRMKENTTYFLWLIPIAFFLFEAVMYPFLPEQFPMQLSTSGEVNTVASKSVALMIMLLIQILLLFFHHKASWKRQLVSVSLLAVFCTFVILYVAVCNGTL